MNLFIKFPRKIPAQNCRIHRLLADLLGWLPAAHIYELLCEIIGSRFVFDFPHPIELEEGFKGAKRVVCRIGMRCTFSSAMVGGRVVMPFLLKIIPFCIVKTLEFVLTILENKR